MKKRPSKVELRSEIEQQMAEYINRGGAVEQIDRGLSGRDTADGPIKPPSTLFGEPRNERTLLPDVVATLEARRRPVKPAADKRSSVQASRKVPIYDDFGEIIRWVWRDQVAGKAD